MKMTLRWFGSAFDSVTLSQIRQIPGVSGVITTLYDVPAGEEWERDRVKALKKEVEESGLKIEGIESVNVSDAIKIGSKERDEHIDNYIKSLKALGEEDIHVVCYNFMPVFDWTRTDLAKMRSDGSTVLAYDQTVVDSINPQTFFDQTTENSNGFVMPGWEPERLKTVKTLFEAYKDIDCKKLFDNLVYFLKAIGPVCEKYDMKMAIHPDDPAWPVFGLPRIITGEESIKKLLSSVDKEYNGLTLCMGSLGTNPKNDIPSIIRSSKGRIHFAHVRNLHHYSPGVFEEAAHLSSDGSFDMYEAVKALHDTGFSGPIRPDHGRTIWGEKCMPGYGLYDRALGAEYILGLWEAVDKSQKRGV